MTNYIQMVLDEQYTIDMIYFECLESQLSAEAEFMLACLENNVILEAPDVVGTVKNIWDRIIAFIQSLFGKFESESDELVKKYSGFIKNKISKIPSYDFTGLSVPCIPYWLAGDTSKITTDAINSLKKRPTSPEELDRLSSNDEVEKYDNFANIGINGLKFSKSAKIKFLAGAKATKIPESRIYKDDEFKNIVTQHMIPYVINYGDKVKRIKQSKDNLKNEIRKIKTEVERSKPVGESFSLLENALFKDTELKYCINSHILFEADVKNQTQTPEAKMKLNKVYDSRPNEPTSRPMNKLEGFYKHATKLVNIVIAAEMTASVKILLAYIGILKGIIDAREPKPAKK